MHNVCGRAGVTHTKTLLFTHMHTIMSSIERVRVVYILAIDHHRLWIWILFKYRPIGATRAKGVDMRVGLLSISLFVLCCSVGHKRSPLFLNVCRIHFFEIYNRVRIDVLNYWVFSTPFNGSKVSFRKSPMSDVVKELKIRLNVWNKASLFSMYNTVLFWLCVSNQSICFRRLIDDLSISWARVYLKWCNIISTWKIAVQPIESVTESIMKTAHRSVRIVYVFNAESFI